ncbi:MULTISPECIES: 23S rRNA (pseudouridine(1915)-N(3))-methyltransferase RlmH [Lactobacillaceae]|uniref:23S rRNA (pseudouridine(1915)-N(3))-methyltransferase RlmH n=1 Tax=Lactobacillaceae TaxID=33958 RepID=UPI000C1B6BC6|nr:MULTISPECIES: 23S rRNA (pseudouridine(1915)-N(3))-methyltransferase RlmH [Lactobacillaceae]
MNIKIITVGKLKEKYLKNGIEEYSKRLSAFCKLQIVECSDEKAPDTLSDAQEKMVKEAEGVRILEKIKDKEYVILLDLRGKELTSEELAAKIDDLSTYGTSDITFIIGGSLGVSDEVYQRADFKLCFGKITYPHQLMRLVLTEQIYRSFMINSHRTYHK